MSQNDVELLPCPFCGGPATLALHKGIGKGISHRGDDVWSIDCAGDRDKNISGCGASAVNRYKKELIISEWNRRTPAVLTDGQLGALKAGAASVILVGGKMSNLCFNIGQWDDGRPITEDAIKSMRELYKRWDETENTFRTALSAFTTPAQAEGRKL
jgi:hypothetical protein